MCSKRPSWLAAGLSALACVAGCALLGLGGCNPNKDQLRPENLFGRIGHGQPGQIIEPKKCQIRVAILDRPSRDEALNDVVWKSADEQVLPPETRRALEVNGLRLGRITGEIPRAIDTILNAPPPHKVEPTSFYLDDGDSTLISVTDTADQVSLLLNRQSHPYGKDYQTVSGYFRVIANHQGTDGVSLRFTPELHHGAVRRSYQPMTSSASYAPQEFKITDGQEEEMLQDMAATLEVGPDQVVVLGCFPEQSRSLGGFFFTRSEAHSDLRRQKLVLIWAARNQLGTPADKVARTDRPEPGGLLDRLAAAAGKTTAAKPRAGDPATKDPAVVRTGGAAATAH
ncbi:hypothetical protein [Aquisphaera insulae]|uniref:hypothetical protein n=1 Tax=Aquisphaera insulae TaxID=2712864 RepID=UPI0013ED27BD|nr:hypothetical protein [Aquisphaera insulae]